MSSVRLLVFNPQKINTKVVFAIIKMEEDKYKEQAIAMMQEAELSTNLHDWGKRENVLNSLYDLLRYDFLKNNVIVSESD